MSVIETTELTKRFHNHEVIHDLSFTVEEGDFFGLVGRNGAGKSTLINILVGLYHLDSGSFKILNRDSLELDSAKREIGVMPDVSTLYGDMNAYEFIAYMAALKGVKLNRQEITKRLEEVGLEVGKRLKIKHFSFGMKKKICIAQALIGNPKLIFLDEPTSGVDPESILRLQSLFWKRNKEGTTIFITSHNLQEIEKLCNKVGFLKDGQFAVCGTLEDIIDKYNQKRVLIAVNERDMQQEEVRKLLSDKRIETEGNRFLVPYLKEEEIEEMVKRLVENQVKIRSVIPQKPTLEEIFLK
ncbi:ABC transporter ATP-binding protein [Roseburia sp. MSJ-14]|uniref:ABC transporter ATP-binding protein n=1 Tax=Roseburia sp. MSJ-14 TaxID=2841514 RepID=UPI001C10AECE|nr:ABC transporter ATP-binding protein [Roseburia sp. MSJ-14]MBU5474116.1 ABC transporter ATP-binding protein [Roseburia sp. MSJ-14]